MTESGHMVQLIECPVCGQNNQVKDVIHCLFLEGKLPFEHFSQFQAFLKNRTLRIIDFLKALEPNQKLSRVISVVCDSLNCPTILGGRIALD